MTDTAREELIEQTNYVQLSGGDFLSAVGMDGKKWADAFMRIWGDKLSDIDHGLMLGWFCNAIMAGYDTAEREIEKDFSILQPRLDAAEGMREALDEALSAAAYMMKVVASIQPHMATAFTETKYDGFGVRGKKALAAYDAAKEPK